MINLSCFGQKLNHLCHSSLTKSACFHKSCCGLLWSSINVLLCRVNPFWIQLFYFTIISSLGFLSLNMFEMRSTSSSTSSIKHLDVFFTSVSAATVSSMSTVEMEVFSNSQLVILTILMLVGGEVFASMLGLQFLRYSKLTKLQSTTNIRIDSVNIDYSNNHHPSTMSIKSDYQIESNLESEKPDKVIDVEIGNKYFLWGSRISDKKLKYNSIKYLSYVVLAYYLLVHFCGSSLVYMYFSLVSNSAGDVLKNKGIHQLTFSIFTIASTFSNCGFIPTNENMMVFKSNSGLLLILIPQILLGNTLFPTCLRIMIWVLERVTKRVEFSYMLNNTRELECSHLLSGFYSTCLAITVFGFIAVQFILFCSMEWSSIALDDLHSHQKLVGSLFQVVNSRHTGESIVDLSIISPAILALFVAMMYLPPYTSFLPIKDDERCPQICEKRNRGRVKIVENLILSQLSYLVIFIIVICITERKKMKEDPLNFNVLNIVVEVISAYGNVGFTTGYSCKRQLNPDDNCKDKWFGFSGKWSDEGKVILIMVMFFGRLKKFNIKGGRRWKLL